MRVGTHGADEGGMVMGQLISAWNKIGRVARRLLGETDSVEAMAAREMIPLGAGTRREGVTSGVGGVEGATISGGDCVGVKADGARGLSRGRRRAAICGDGTGLTEEGVNRTQLEGAASADVTPREGGKARDGECGGGVDVV